jgi:tetratricopeptide (TPR) repeat protein
MVASVSQRLIVIVLLAGIPACSKESADDHARRGNDFVSQELLKEAVVEYRAALQIDPQRGDVRMRLADTLMLLSDTAAALKEYVRAADVLPNDASAQIKAGTLLLMAGAFEDAKARAEKAVALAPQDATGLVLRGNALAALKNIDGAIAEYQEALVVDPAREAAYAHMATIQIARGQREEAEASFRKAIEVAPWSVGARQALANLLWVSQRPADAEKVLKEALALEPANLLTNRMLGALYVGTNRPAAAEPHFKTYEQTAKTIAASLSLADYYVLAKRFDEARRTLAKLAAQDPSRDAAMIRLAAVDVAEGQRAQALAKLREVLERQPSQGTARLLLARLLLTDGQRDEALVQATRVVSEEPDSPAAADAFLVIGNIHALNDRTEAAVSAYQEVLKRQSSHFAANLALASLNLGTGVLEAARPHAEQALAVQPQNLDARGLMVRILLAQKELRRAKEMLASLQKDFPNTPAVFALQGDVQLSEGRVDAARVSYERAGLSAPNSVQTLSRLVETDLATGNVTNAIARIEAALKVQRAGDLLLFAARIYAAAGYREKTEAMLMQTIAADPGRLQPYRLLGALYVGENRLDEAHDRFMQVLEKDPKSVAMNTVMGMLLEMQQRVPEAEKYYQTVLAIDPRFPIAANNLAWLYVQQNKNLDEALQLAETAQQSAPDDSEINDTLGWILYRKKMSDRAIRHLELSVQKAPGDAVKHYHLGMAYRQAGFLDKAKASLQRAVGSKSEFDGVVEARAILSQLGG